MTYQRPSSADFSEIYIAPFINQNTQTYIHNVETEVKLFSIGEHRFPGCINHTEYHSSYVCSIYNALIDYASEEVSKVGNQWIEYPIRALIASLAGLLKFGRINQNVFINNFLLSTNLYPAWDGLEIPEFTQNMIQAYPQHALIFRSLNYHTNKNTLNNFKKTGYQLIPTRQVYLFDKKINNYDQRRNIKKDKILLQKTSYKIVQHHEISAEDYPRIVLLYNKLYLEKYSKHNPQYTEKMIAHWHQHNLLYMQALRHPKGHLDGIIGCFENDELTSAPLVGYDTDLPQDLGLYRLLILLIIQRSENKILNLSSGAPDYKRNRGGQAFIEYAAIYTQHLPLKRRLIWRLVNFILSYLFVPILKKYQL